jgi:hypothetical protein
MYLCGDCLNLFSAPLPCLGSGATLQWELNPRFAAQLIRWLTDQPLIASISGSTFCFTLKRISRWLVSVFCIDMSSILHNVGEFSSAESYSLMADGEEDTGPAIFLQRHPQAIYCFPTGFFQLNFWAFSTLVLAICLFAYFVREHNQYSKQYTYENGYDTEFCKCCVTALPSAYRDYLIFMLAREMAFLTALWKSSPGSTGD